MPLTSWMPAQIAYWENVFAKVVASDEWKHEVGRAGGVTHFMGSRELARFFDEQYAQFRGVLLDLGLAK